MTHLLHGARFNGNEIGIWERETHYKKTVTNAIHASYIDYTSYNMVHCHNTSSSSTLNYNDNTVWTLNHTQAQNSDENSDDYLPAGIYKLSFVAAHNNINTSDVTLSFKINDGEELRTKLNSVGTDNVDDAAKEIYGDNRSKYTFDIDFTLAEGGEIKFYAHKAKTNSITSFYLGDITLTYYGPDPTKVCADIQAAIDDASAKVAQLPADCQAGWDDDMAPYRAIVASQDVVGDGSSEINAIYRALAAHVFLNKVEGADFTNAIINNSFERGDLFGWEATVHGDTGIRKNESPWDVSAKEGTYTIDGTYLFNTWDGDNWGSPIHQSLFGMPVGHYKLEALFTTNQAGSGTYLIGGTTHSDLITIGLDGGTFYNVEYEFDVIDEGAETFIGIASATPTGAYDANGGVWYKADNFRLTYLGKPTFDNFYHALQQAIDYNTAELATLPDNLKATWAEWMAPYEQMIADRTLEGDGTAEIAEIHALLHQLVYSQTEAGADYTPAIENHSFENGNLDGWTITSDGDTAVRENINAWWCENADGDYLFNTWAWKNADGDWGSPITQTLPALPAGIYRLEALLATNGGRGVWLTVDCGNENLPVAERRTLVQVETVPGEDGGDIAKIYMHEAAIEFAIDEPTDVTIGAVGAISGTGFNANAGEWYKADNFRLTLVEPYTEELSALTPLQGPWQMTESGRYYVVARHESGHHVMAPNDRGHRAILDDDNNIAKHLRGHELKATKLDDNTWTLSGNKTEVAGILAVADNDLHVTFDDSEAHTITNAYGTPLAFDPASKTFGYSDAHSVADVALYTDVDVNTGIGAVTVDADTPAAVYYNLQGVRVDNPTAGLYIKVVGRTATKVMVK